LHTAEETAGDGYKAYWVGLHIAEETAGDGYNAYWGLTVVVGELRMNDMYELVRLRKCERLGDTWAWVTPSPERQHAAVVGAPEDVEGAHADVEGDQAVLAPRDIVDTIARDFSRFTVWAASGISQLLDATEATYTRYFETHVPYQRHMVRCRTNNASTTAASHTANQPDP
nr:hypothetical protein [Tanacetum cinerariifolium]